MSLLADQNGWGKHGWKMAQHSETKNLRTMYEWWAKMQPCEYNNRLIMKNSIILLCFWQYNNYYLSVFQVWLIIFSYLGYPASELYVSRPEVLVVYGKFRLKWKQNNLGQVNRSLKIFIIIIIYIYKAQNTITEKVSLRTSKWNRK